jgi:hypothetical protein
MPNRQGLTRKIQVLRSQNNNDWGGFCTWWGINVGRLRPNRILLIAVLLIIVVLLVAAWSVGLFSAEKVEYDEVHIAVESSGNWTGAYTNGHHYYIWNGSGTKTINLTKRYTPRPWVVSASARKLTSNGTIHVVIWVGDDKVLREASTSSPYGIVQVACVVNS